MSQGLIVLVTGSREFADYAAVHDILSAVEDRAFIEHLVHGHAPGVDTLAAVWARDHSHVDPRAFPPFYKTYGTRAPVIRNSEMVKWVSHYAREFELEALCVSFPGGRGTADCTRKAQAAGIPVQYARPLNGVWQLVDSPSPTERSA